MSSLRTVVGGRSDDSSAITIVGHPVRRQILAMLAGEQASAKQLSVDLELALSSVSYHVAVLRDAGLLEPAPPEV